MAAITRKYIDEKGRLVMTRLGRMSDGDDRSFDIEFWQSLTDDQRLAAAWELVEDAHVLKGGNLDELRLQRSVTSLKRRRR